MSPADCPTRISTGCDREGGGAKRPGGHRLSESTVLAATLLQVPVVAAYLYVGALLSASARSDARSPVAFFALFWLGVGAYGAAEVVWAATALAGFSGFHFGVVILNVKLVSISVGFFGLVAYLLYIYSGRKWFLWGLAAAYAFLYLVLQHFYTWKGPVGQSVGVWGMRLDYAVQDPGAYWTLVVVLLFVPPMLAAVAYAGLLRVARQPASRYRVVVTSVAFLLFFGVLPLGWLNGDWYWWGLVEKMLGAGTAVAVLAAVAPPAWARERFGAEPVVDLGLGRGRASVDAPAGWYEFDGSRREAARAEAEALVLDRAREMV